MCYIGEAMSAKCLVRSSSSYLLRAGQGLCWRLNQLSAGTIIRPRLPLPDKLLYDPLSTFSWQSISNPWYTCSHATDVSFVPVGFPFENMIDIVMRFSIERWWGFVRIVRLCLEDTVINGKMLFQPYLKGFCPPEGSTKNRNHIMEAMFVPSRDYERDLELGGRCLHQPSDVSSIQGCPRREDFRPIIFWRIGPECHALCWSEHVWYIKLCPVTPLKREICLEHPLFYVSAIQQKIAVQWCIRLVGTDTSALKWVSESNFRADCLPQKMKRLLRFRVLRNFRIRRVVNKSTTKN
jgi:hypothetical protein